MKRFGKYATLAIWMFLFSYLGDILEVPKNIYYVFIGFPLLLGGGFLIFYLFEKGDENRQ
ncbi:hypothetical protein ACJ2A9_06140 [Anaerobacillus sp. MEB173]|uniref:hypothetical protein n=1 Tax=Anaerobacillus sp. MEB173 TaxID=3383345 RepID=UPI003F926E16